MSDKKRKVPKLRFPGFTDSWEQRKLGDVVEKCYGGGTPQTSVEEYWTGNIPWLQSSNLVDDDVQSVKIEKYISKEAIDKSAAKMIPSHSIAIVTRVGIGKLVLMDESYTTSQDFLSLSNVMLEKQFMLYALYLLLKNEKRKGQGTSIKGITKEALLGKSIRFPKTSIEQHQIGNFVKLFDSLISLHQRKLDNVKMLKKSLLQKLFPKDGEKTPELRFPGFTDAWEQRKLIDYLEVSKEKNKDGTFDKEDVLSVSGFYGIVNQIEFQGRSFAGSSVANYGVVKNGDVVYTKSPLKSNPYGIIKTNKGNPGVVSTLYAVYRPLKNTHSDFIQTYFEQDARMNNYMSPLVNKGAKNDMKVSDENALKGEVIFPSKEEQVKISDYFEMLNKLLSLHQRKLDHLKELKKGLLQQMFV